MAAAGMAGTSTDTHQPQGQVRGSHQPSPATSRGSTCTSGRRRAPPARAESVASAAPSASSAAASARGKGARKSPHRRKDSDELAPLRAVGSAAADFSAAASPARPQRNKAAAARTQSERDHQSAFAPAPRQANSGRRQSGGQRQRQSPSVRQTATFAHRPPDRRKSQREDNLRKSTSNGSTLPGGGSSASGRKALQFKLEPEYFIVASRTAAGGPAGARGEEEVIYVTEDGAPVTAAQAARLKEQNQRRVKQLVAAVGITLTVLSVLLVAASLAFGNKIDKLGDEYKTEAEKWKPPWEIDVDSASRGSASELSGDRNSGFYLGRQPHWEPSTSSTVAPQSDGASALKSSTPGAGANAKVDADDSGDGNHDASKVKLNSVGRVAQKKKWGKGGLGMNIR